jgi:F0F1-type ATP synthase membrane subunit b/b'
MRWVALVLMALLLMIGCGGEDKGTYEEAGAAVDAAVDEAQDTAEEAVEDAKEEAEELKQEAEDATGD